MAIESAQQAAAIPEIEGIIKRLRGVGSARVTTDGQGSIAEIHVVVDESRSPKQVGRDVESALMSELGLRVDHRKISVAQVRGGTAAAGAALGIRLKFLSANFHIGRTGVEVKVGLGQNSDTFQGIAQGSDEETQQLQLVARATLGAVEEYLRFSLDREPPRLEIEEVSSIEPGRGSEAVLVLVRMRDDGREERLLGSALVKADRLRTAAWATLDAINRRLARLTH